MVPQCQLSQDLVAQHMRVLYHISASRDAVFTGYFSEPVLVQAAGQLTNVDALDDSPARWTVFLRSLLKSLKNVQVNAGFRGELVARILLMLAWDRCCLIDLAPKARLSSAVYLKPVQLTKFLHSLLCLSDEVQMQLETKFNNDQSRAWVRCSHFVKIDYVPNDAQLLELFRRGAAVVTKELQTGSDLLIPIIFCIDESVEVTADMVSCIFVQVKNRKDKDPGYPQTATVLQTPKATGVTISEVRPYLSLYMSFGPHLGQENLAIETLKMPCHQTRGKGKKVQDSTNEPMCLAVFTLSDRVYKPLVDNPELQPLLHLINRSWVDPVALQESEEDGILVAKMLPFQCKGQRPSVSPADMRDAGPSAGGSGSGVRQCKGPSSARPSVPPADMSDAGPSADGSGSDIRRRRKRAADLADQSPLGASGQQAYLPDEGPALRSRTRRGAA
eukprot:CAMPEP_0172186056 /NCGR_PEP_ID=MMETSP1050-20130122/20526_1 /TAXON_ID=233186 /ORGANISM="Cryptomonas curvata, Strain CCAP979/52" /LENGTH=444 /DNA_ID=CAMNT_0012860137 /DNA_START=276 /DNA_END=1610 /DNA_ORIENTATION=-